MDSPTGRSKDMGIFVRAVEAVTVSALAILGLAVVLRAIWEVLPRPIQMIGLAGLGGLVAHFIAVPMLLTLLARHAWWTG